MTKEESAAQIDYSTKPNNKKIANTKCTRKHPSIEVLLLPPTLLPLAISLTSLVDPSERFFDDEPKRRNR